MGRCRPLRARRRGRRVLVVGDANPDLVLRGDVVPRFGQAEQLLDDASLLVGGSASITAHGLARLGRPVSLVAAVGDDQFGAFLTGRLAEAGVDVGHVAVRPDLPTGLTVVLSRGDDRAMLTLTGALDSLTEADLHDALEDLQGSGLRHVHVGSLFLLPSLGRLLPAFLALARSPRTDDLARHERRPGRDGGRAWTHCSPTSTCCCPTGPRPCALGRDRRPAAGSGRAGGAAAR